MDKSEFILTGEETAEGREICITHITGLSEEEFNLLLELTLMMNLELHPMLYYRIDGDKIHDGIHCFKEKDFEATTVTRINKNQFESMVLDVKRSNMFIRDYFGYPVELFEYFDPLPEAYDD